MFLLEALTEIEVQNEQILSDIASNLTISINHQPQAVIDQGEEQTIANGENSQVKFY